MTPKKLTCVLFIFCFTLFCFSSHSIADDSNSDSTESIQLPEVMIAAPTPELIDSVAELPGTLTVPNNAEATRIIQRTPGGVYVIGAKRFKDRFSINYQDTLSHVPGVYATKRFAEEVRISIRGSGLERNFHQKGLTALQDGIPFTSADGAGDFQEIDNLVLQRIEIHKGGNAMQFGGTTLGGAVNMISKTGRSHPGHRLRFDFGSNDTFRGNYQTGQAFEKADLFLSLSGAVSNGFREHANQENLKFNSNVGVKLGDQAESRFYFTVNEIDLDLPGTVTLKNALKDPQGVRSSALEDDQQRDIRSYRFSNKTTIELSEDHKVDVGVFAYKKELFHPITRFVGVIDQESINYGFYSQASGTYKIGRFLNRYRAGITTQFGDTEAKVFRNNGGRSGSLTRDADQFGTNIVVYGENHFHIIPKLAIVTGLQYLHADRDVDDNVTPSDTDDADYDTANPKVGIMFKPLEKTQIFANISRSYEPPDFTDLTQGSTAGFIQLDAQKAWTAEVGTRGEYGRIAWDISLYRAWIEDELLKFTVDGNIPSTTFNADDTIHQGAEIGIGIDIFRGLFTEKDTLKWWNAYTYSDFFLDDDDQFGDNTIPGQPPHFYNTELRYDYGDKWFFALNALVASDAEVDFNNSFEAPGYAIMGMSAGFKINDHADVFFEGRNLTNEAYISNFSTAVTATDSSALFYAGDLRRFFGGVRINF